MTRELRVRLALTAVLATAVGLSYGYFMDLSGLWFAIPAGCLVGKVVHHLPLPRRLTEERTPAPARRTSTLPARRLEKAA